jgi:hypothetical protein
MNLEAIIAAARAAAGTLSEGTWRMALRLLARDLINCVGQYEFVRWIAETDDRMLPRDALWGYYGGTISMHLRERIGRAIEHHPAFGRLQTFVRGEVGEHPISEGALRERATRAIAARERNLRFDSTLRAVVGGIHSIELQRAAVDAAGWRVVVEVSDTYDFDNDLPPGPRLRLRNRMTELLLASRYEDFLLLFAAMLDLAPLQSDDEVSKPAVIAYYFHACEKAGIFDPIPWSTTATLRGSWQRRTLTF